jgi:hypothetical protein
LNVVVALWSAALVAATAVSRDEIPDNTRVPSRAPVNRGRIFMLLPFSDG